MTKINSKTWVNGLRPDTAKNGTWGPWTLALCLTPAIGELNGNFLQTFFIVTYGLAPLQYIRFRNLSDLEFDLSRLLKVMCDDVIGLSINVFLLIFNSNIWPNWAPLLDIRLQNLSDLEFDPSRSLKVKCDSVVGLPIYAFLSVFNSNVWPNSAPLQDIRFEIWVTLNLTLQGHSRSNMMMCD